MSAETDDDYQVWLRAVKELLRKGERMEDAIEGANIVVRARKHARPPPPSPRSSGTVDIGTEDDLGSKQGRAS
jgi:hypothetical protein